MREVAEEMRKEGAIAIWRKYKLYIILVIALALGATITYNAIEARKGRIAAENALEFERITALPDAERLAQLKTFARAAEYGYRDIAYQNIYALEVEAGKKEDAIATLKEAAARATDREFRNIALVKLALIPEYTASEEGYAEALKSLESIGRRAPLYYSAKFTRALLLSRRGNVDLARGLLDEIKADEAAPAAVKSQAYTLLSYIRDNRE
jgi:hypothetical protein